jgi:hypothetical protein
MKNPPNVVIFFFFLVAANKYNDQPITLPGIADRVWLDHVLR